MRNGRPATLAGRFVELRPERDRESGGIESRVTRVYNGFAVAFRNGESPLVGNQEDHSVFRSAGLRPNRAESPPGQSHADLERIPGTNTNG